MNEWMLSNWNWKSMLEWEWGALKGKWNSIIFWIFVTLLSNDYEDRFSFSNHHQSSVFLFVHFFLTGEGVESKVLATAKFLFSDKTWKSKWKIFSHHSVSSLARPLWKILRRTRKNSKLWIFVEFIEFA